MLTIQEYWMIRKPNNLSLSGFATYVNKLGLDATKRRLAINWDELLNKYRMNC